MWRRTRPAVVLQLAGQGHDTNIVALFLKSVDQLDTFSTPTSSLRLLLGIAPHQRDKLLRAHVFQQLLLFTYFLLINVVVWVVDNPSLKPTELRGVITRLDVPLNFRPLDTLPCSSIVFTISLFPLMTAFVCLLKDS